MGTLLLDCTLATGTHIIREAYAEHPVQGLFVLFYVIVSNVIIMGSVSALLIQAIRTAVEIANAAAEIKSAVAIISGIWDNYFKLSSNSIIDIEELPLLLLRDGVPSLLH